MGCDSERPDRGHSHGAGAAGGGVMITMETVRVLAQERVRAALAVDPVRRFGRIVRANGEVLHASGIRAQIGSRCLIEMEAGAKLAAEVVGFEEGGLLLMPEQGTRGVMRGARVHVEGREHAPMMGRGLLGRVVDARGLPLDGKAPPDASQPW